MSSPVSVPLGRRASVVSFAPEGNQSASVSGDDVPYDDFKAKPRFERRRLRNARQPSKQTSTPQPRNLAQPQGNNSVLSFRMLPPQRRATYPYIVPMNNNSNIAMQQQNNGGLQPQQPSATPFQAFPHVPPNTSSHYPIAQNTAPQQQQQQPTSNGSVMPYSHSNHSSAQSRSVQQQQQQQQSNSTTQIIPQQYQQQYNSGRSTAESSSGGSDDGETPRLPRTLSAIEVVPTSFFKKFSFRRRSSSSKSSKEKSQSTVAIPDNEAVEIDDTIETTNRSNTYNSMPYAAHHAPHPQYAFPYVHPAAMMQPRYPPGMMLPHQQQQQQQQQWAASSFWGNSLYDNNKNNNGLPPMQPHPQYGYQQDTGPATTEDTPFFNTNLLALDTTNAAGREGDKEAKSGGGGGGMPDKAQESSISFLGSYADYCLPSDLSDNKLTAGGSPIMTKRSRGTGRPISPVTDWSQFLKTATGPSGAPRNGTPPSGAPLPRRQQRTEGGTTAPPDEQPWFDADDESAMMKGIHASSTHSGSDYGPSSSLTNIVKSANSNDDKRDAVNDSMECVYKPSPSLQNVLGEYEM